MPPRRKINKGVQMTERTVVLDTKLVPIKDLRTYHKNPRIGDPDLVAKSLYFNGQFKPIIVNVGTHTGRKNEILCGNHTYIGARRELEWESLQKDGTMWHHKKEPWDKILVSFVDVDDDAAAKIVLADNRTAENSTYDDEVLADIFKQIDDIGVSDATGYSYDEVTDILSGIDVDEVIDNTRKQLKQQEEEEEAERKRNTFEGAPLGEEAEFEDDEPETDAKFRETDGADDSTVEGQSEALKGNFQFKAPDAEVYEGVGFLQIPQLRNDMLMTFDDLPDTLDSWAGSATKDDDEPDRWWLYNWGVDSTSGMKDISKVIVSFYCFDRYFEGWWENTDRYMAKLHNSGIKYMITPNFSQPSELPRVEAAWQLYRARWIGRYAQECGLYVAPDITWRDGDAEWLEKMVLGTLPVGIPLISLQLQTIDEENMDYDPKDFVKHIEMVFKKLKPKGALIYTGPQGREYMKKVDTGDTKLKFLGTRMEKLSKQAANRQKKSTI